MHSADHREAHHSSFCSTEHYGNIPTEPPANEGVEYNEYEKIAIFNQYLAISQKWYKIRP